LTNTTKNVLAGSFAISPKPVHKTLKVLFDNVLGEAGSKVRNVFGMLVCAQTIMGQGPVNIGFSSFVKGACIISKDK